jgi:hypothetical protein
MSTEGSFGSRASSNGVPKIAGSTSRRSFSAAAASSPISSRAIGRALASANKLPFYNCRRMENEGDHTRFFATAMGRYRAFCQNRCRYAWAIQCGTVRVHRATLRRPAGAAPGHRGRSSGGCAGISSPCRLWLLSPMTAVGRPFSPSSFTQAGKRTPGSPKGHQ